MIVVRMECASVTFQTREQLENCITEHRREMHGYMAAMKHGTTSPKREDHSKALWSDLADREYETLKKLFALRKDFDAIESIGPADKAARELYAEREAYKERGRIMHYIDIFCDWANGVQGPEADMARHLHKWLDKDQAAYDAKYS